MGNYIEKTCIKLIINNYLEKSIPSYTSDLDSFDNITAETKNYEEFLKSKGKKKKKINLFILNLLLYKFYNNNNNNNNNNYFYLFIYYYY